MKRAGVQDPTSLIGHCPDYKNVPSNLLELLTDIVISLLEMDFNRREIEILAKYDEDEKKGRAELKDVQNKHAKRIRDTEEWLRIHGQRVKDIDAWMSEDKGGDVNELRDIMMELEKSSPEPIQHERKRSMSFTTLFQLAWRRERK
jgi:hypothetical protein